MQNCHLEYYYCFISLIETFLSRCCTLSDLETRNKSQLTEKNIFIHSQGSKLSLSVSKSLKWLSEALIDFATTWVSSLPLYLFILQLFTLSLLQFDFILEMREKNVEKMLFRSLHCVQFWQRRKNTVWSLTQSQNEKQGCQ